MSYLNELKSYLRDINLEILMESPDVRIANFGYSVSQKIGITGELSNSSKKMTRSEDEYNKHIEDLKQIIIKYNIKCKL